MSQSRLDRLGLNLLLATDEQIEVVESLSDAEIELLIRIKDKLDDAAGDIEGHSLEAGGVVW